MTALKRDLEFALGLRILWDESSYVRILPDWLKQRCNFVLSGTYSISGSISIEKNLFWFCRIMTLRTERDCIKFPAFQQNRINLLRKGHMEASCLSAHVFGVRLGQMVQAGFLAAE